MQAILSPKNITGTVHAPASKSAMQRACAAALLKEGTTVIHNPGISNDDIAAQGIIQQLGARIKNEENNIVIESNGVQPVANSMHCGESGLSVRMFTSIAALAQQAITITGEGSLTTRPMDFFNEVLPQLNVVCTSNNGKLPMQVKGPLQPKNITVDGSLSSQFLTGLLMAYAAAGAQDVTITVNDLTSKPYVDLTLSIMQSFHLKVPHNKEYNAFYFDEMPLKKTNNQPLHYTVEGDWSGAAFLLVAGAIAGNIKVLGLDVFSTQADKAILQALVQAGAQMSVQEGEIYINGGALKAFHFNATQCPDLFPPLVALAAYCQGTTVIEGVGRLAHKESNRALTLQQEFGKMGVVITLQDDLMIIAGGNGVQGAAVHSHHDHRIAMACAVAALKADGDSTIAVADAVNKSYPNFWQHLQGLGAVVSLNNN